MNRVPRILFLCPGHQDYLADGILHGLRAILGTDAVDYPKSQHLYVTASDSTRSRLWGKGFTLSGLLPDPEIDRSFVLTRALDGEFDLVIFADIWHQFGLWTEWGPQLQKAGVRLAVLDGSDRPASYPYHWRWWRRPSWWLLPRAHNRATVFKREITPRTRWYASYLMLPPAFGRTLGLRPVSFSIPGEKIIDHAPTKETDFPRHIVDPELAVRLGTSTGHAFTSEEDYYNDLQRSRFGITTKRAGWDAMRHYEIAANCAVPCFRDLDRKPATCAPFGLDATNCIIYHDADDLLAQIAVLDETRYEALQTAAMAWVRANTTVARAKEVLTACGISLPGSDAIARSSQVDDRVQPGHRLPTIEA